SLENRGDRSNDDGNQQRKQQTRRYQHEGIRQTRADDGVDRLTTGNRPRFAEIAVQDAAHPDQVALVDRFVQTDHLVQPFQVAGVLDMRRGDTSVERPARRQVEDAEQEHRGEHQRDRHFDAPAYQEFRHRECKGARSAPSIITSDPTPRRSTFSRWRRTQASSWPACWRPRSRWDGSTAAPLAALRPSAAAARSSPTGARLAPGYWLPG